MRRMRLMAAMLATLVLGVTTSADEINVGPSQSIQAAIDSASDGDVILVSAGTYTEEIDFDGKAITIRSLSGAALTTIDANGGESVVSFQSGEGSLSVLDGFTLTGGNGTDFGVRTRGGAVFVFNASPTVRNCIMTGNSAEDGGAVALDNSISPSFTNCLIYGNTSIGFAWGGGAFYSEFSNPVVVNSTIYDNAAAEGSAFYNVSSVSRLINCIVWDNTGAGGVFYASNPGSVPIISYSLIQGDFPGTGNIGVDPQFVDPGAGNLRLSATSPAIDRGDSTAIAESVFEDVAGDNRGVDDPNTPDRGIAVFALTVDMGAYEVQVPSDLGSCPGDVSGAANVPDNEISFFDLLYILSNWGACP